ncbi:MAG: hypothetical protein AABX52_03530 [Nanoarchaeota archaeon]
MKKAQELSVTVIVVAAIALIVLVVLVAIFTGRLGKFGIGVSKVEQNTCNSNCENRGYASGTVQTTTCSSETPEITAFISDVPEGSHCCCKLRS